MQTKRKKDDHRRRPHIPVLLVPKQLLITRAVIDRFQFGFRRLLVQNCFYHLSERHMKFAINSLLKYAIFATFCG